MTKMWIRIAVKHQDACIEVGCILRSIDNNKNDIYVEIIDDLYVIAHARRRLCVTYW